MSMFSLNCLIASDNPVRLIDLFVEQLDLAALGFTKTDVKQEGCPPYHAKDMLKLYYYGYLNRVRSSRKLASECMRNVEVWWLIHQLMPAYHTIANFRKDNAVAFKKAFKQFVSFLKGEELVSAKIVAVDGTKIRAQNNKDKNFNEAALVKRIAYIENKTQEYITQLDECDALEDKQAGALKKAEVAEKIKTLVERKDKYEKISHTLAGIADKQVSLVDAESRSLSVKGEQTDVCYNIQTAADSMHSLIVEFDTVNEGDQNQLSPMATRAMETLQAKEITVIADKGYHTGSQLMACEQGGITTLVAYPDRSTRAKQIDPAYQLGEFKYDRDKDCYTCPAGAILTTTGVWFDKRCKDRVPTHLVKRYTTPLCSSCPVSHLCTSSQPPRRILERSAYQDAIDANNKRVDEQWKLYKKRQEIVEHPFGTIKRGWGYGYTLLKGIKKVNGEMAIIFTVYNLRRAITILGVTELLNRLTKWKPVPFLQNTGLLRSVYGKLFNTTRRAA